MPSKAVMSFSLPPEMQDALRAESREKDIPVSSIIRNAIRRQWAAEQSQKTN